MQLLSYALCVLHAMPFASFINSFGKFGNCTFWLNDNWVIQCVCCRGFEWPFGQMCVSQISSRGVGLITICLLWRTQSTPFRGIFIFGREYNCSNAFFLRFTKYLTYERYIFLHCYMSLINENRCKFIVPRINWTFEHPLNYTGSFKDGFSSHQGTHLPRPHVAIESSWPKPSASYYAKAKRLNSDIPVYPIDWRIKCKLNCRNIWYYSSQSSQPMSLAKVWQTNLQC